MQLKYKLIQEKFFEILEYFSFVKIKHSTEINQKRSSNHYICFRDLKTKFHKNPSIVHTHPTYIYTYIYIEVNT